ncbi:hypothetical protein B0H19DRAFT_1332879 [Mycena capillaripes]|nr:hypothetical protein B0H19DRAFT_1332879 [Mycena capillaripes]
MSSTKALCFIGIHCVPPNLSRTEFEAKVGAFGAARGPEEPPQISQNTLMDKHMKSAELPIPSPTVIMSAECESLGHLAQVLVSVFLQYEAEIHLPTQILKDPAFQKLLTESDDFGFRTATTALAADIVTKIDAPRAMADTNLKWQTVLKALKALLGDEGWMVSVGYIVILNARDTYEGIVNEEHGLERISRIAKPIAKIGVLRRSSAVEVSQRREEVKISFTRTIS